jgi:TRAP-type C4-dicarboxylate transport system substrate-binding protein
LLREQALGFRRRDPSHDDRQHRRLAQLRQHQAGSSSPADMEGLKIRTVVADLPQELVKALGASPTPIPWPELFTSFQTGVVEGSKNGITDIMGMKFPDAGLKYVTLDGHAYMGALWYMNNEKFMSMPEDLRRVVVDGFAALQQATFASPKRKSIQAYKEFAEIGGSVYVPTMEEKASSGKPQRRCSSGSRPMFRAVRPSTTCWLPKPPRLLKSSMAAP